MSIFIIAEIGINHNGDMSIWKKLIDAAVETGCNAVKFQKHDLDQVYTQEFLDSFRESPWGKTQREQKSGLEFNADEYQEIEDYCKERCIEWFASAWDVESIVFLDRYNLEYSKVASAMIVDTKLLNEIADRKMHTFISTYTQA